MHPILEQLERYFRTTPKEQILRDWAESEDFANVGPDIKEYVEFINKMCEYNTLVKCESPWEFISEQKNKNKGPEFSSDFFYIFANISVR